MAARKKTTKKDSAVAVSSPSDLSLPGDWEAELSEYVEQDAAAATGGSGWDYIQTKGGIFRYNEEVLPETMSVVILGAMRANLYYEGDYDPNNPQGPTCFALNTSGVEAEMAPPDDVIEGRQNDLCRTCPQNAFGSADRGRGKACKNTVRLAVLPWSGDADVEGAMLSVPPTSLKHFTAYQKKLGKGFKRPLFSVATNITIAEDPKTIFKLTFDLESAFRDRDVIMALKARADEARGYLEQSPMLADLSDSAPATGKKKVRRRKVSR